MTRFGKKSITLLVVGSLVAGLGAMAVHMTMVSAEKSKRSLEALAQSEAEFGRVKEQLDRWLKVQATGEVTVPRVEPVALSADFSPEEFPGINRVLAGMYADNGFLNLRSFVFTLSGTAGPGGNVAHVTVSGEKVFMQ
ncbi:MAG: hypothetical protein U1C96_12510 [Gallionella sp.]|nr:hypothetical protein [Gallionella sp.]